MIGSHEVMKAMQEGSDPRNVLEEIEDSLVRFVERREKYLLYR